MQHVRTEDIRVEICALFKEISVDLHKKVSLAAHSNMVKQEAFLWKILTSKLHTSISFNKQYSLKHKLNNT